jgi:carbamate kinase
MQLKSKARDEGLQLAQVSDGVCRNGTLIRAPNETVEVHSNGPQVTMKKLKNHPIVFRQER